MRPLLALFPLLAACEGDRVLLHNSVLPGATQAIALGADAADLHAQRPDGTLVQRATRNGRVLEVFDPQPDQVERLLDISEGEGQAAVLAASDDALYIWRDGIADEPLRQDPGGEGVVHAAFCGGGLVLIRPPVGDAAEDPAAPACQAEFSLDEDAGTVPLPAEACDPATALAADPLEPVAWLAGPEGVWLLTPEGSRVLDGSGDLAVFDPTVAGAVVGFAGGRELEAWDADGASAWYSSFNQEIRAISDLGTAGAVAIATAAGVGGTVTVIDAATGDALVATTTPVPGRTISGSPGGDMLALGLADEVHTFLVRLRNGK